jgi:hypothetical protein
VTKTVLPLVWLHVLRAGHWAGEQTGWLRENTDSRGSDSNGLFHPISLERAHHEGRRWQRLPAGEQARELAVHLRAEAGEAAWQQRVEVAGRELQGLRGAAGGGGQEVGDSGGGGLSEGSRGWGKG